MVPSPVPSVVSSVLLRRLRTVYVDQPGPRPGDPPTTEGLAALEAELLDRGYAPGAELRATLGWLGPTGLGDAGRRLLGALDAELGVDRPHMPLFRSFPASVPDDTFGLYVDRVLALLLQWPEQPCVRCGETGTVHPVAPCAHLVCRTCWDGADYSACPLCHRRIDPADPFLTPRTAAPAPAEPAGEPETAAGPLRLLALGRDLPADVVRVLLTLLARRTPLPPDDRDDVTLLLAHAPAGLDWLPADIPVRETKALVLGTLLREPATRDAATALLGQRLTTATDVLRLLAVRSGGGADLLEPRRFRSMPRSLRRLLLGVLDGFAVTSLVEDLRRHPGLWKKAAEVLHPFEAHERHPRAALAFAVLRGTPLRDPDTGADGPLGAALRRTAAAHPEAVRVDGDRIKPDTWTGRVEAALAARDADTALGLLAGRPGELLRRLDHLLRLRPAEEPWPRLAEVLGGALAGAGPGPLLAALGRLRIRDLPGDRRVFFPRGRVTHAYSLDDTRPPLPPALVSGVCALLEAEVLRRLAGAPRFETAVLDADLSGLAVPSAEGAAAQALVSVPRGSTQPLPRGEVLRMFLHWTEPPRIRVDLDLSVALFTADWSFAGLCDYTNLVFGKRAVVHSGDLTSAPAPDGATEYADLDLAELSAAGVRFAMPIVLSYNNVAFEQLLDAFAGFMALPSREGRDATYDPRTVRQRYDLAGDARIHVPMLVDLEHRTFLWTDLHLPPAEGFQSVRAHSEDLGRVGRDLHDYFATGRTTLWDLAVWHAAARTDAVHVLRRGRGPLGDEVAEYRRGADEPVVCFADRIRRGGPPELRHPTDDGPALAARAAAGRHAFLALLDGDVAPAGATGTVYRLLPGPVDGGGLAPAAAGDLVAELG
ncbi:MXAN_6230/SCO0854 family RING domain-containing protein [Streptomyces sp. NPDC048659]|uniref:MXAN_6230/SCO0854 family RING domain-containing protein n=1 Tax=Streptomyces sp. NPDC048659 TaxID=3155489 RepID=UPI0034303819